MEILNILEEGGGYFSLFIAFFNLKFWINWITMEGSFSVRNLQTIYVTNNLVNYHFSV